MARIILIFLSMFFFANVDDPKEGKMRMVNHIKGKYIGPCTK